MSKKMRDAVCDNGEEVRGYFGATDFFLLVMAQHIGNRRNYGFKRLGKLGGNATIAFY